MKPTPLHFALKAFLGQTLTPAAAARIVALAHGKPESHIDPARFSPLVRDGYTIAVERFEAITDELDPLHAAHWLETEGHRHGLALKPDYDAMAYDEACGNMLQFTVRHAGVLVGQLRMYLCHSRHTSTTVAQEDALFVVPAHRGGLIGLRLLRYAESCLRELGVTSIEANSKLVNNADVLMRRMGFKAVATQFVKIFDSGHVV